MPHIVKEVVVRRPPETVFFALTDLAARRTWARLEECRTKDGGPLAVGSRLVERKHLGLVVAYEVAVVALEPPRLLETTVHADGKVYGRSRIELSPAEGGSFTLVRETFDLEVGGVERVATRAAGAMLDVEIRHDLNALKQYSEGLLARHPTA